MLSPEDIKQLASKEISQDQLKAQIDRFKKGFEPLQLAAAATIGQGIMQLSENDIEDFVSGYEGRSLETIKFVPASGAASRMFKALFALLDMDESELTQDATAQQFFLQIKDFAFFDDLKSAFESIHDVVLEEAIDKKDKRVIATLLKENGLDYGSLPKGLLRFHRYSDDVRTPVQEHIAEGLSYASKDGEVNIHFTVSPDHQVKFEQHVAQVLSSTSYADPINITYSTQKNSTDTVAVDLDNEVFRDDQGAMLFRPAGHGALLENLNQLNSDIVFVKNIK